MQKVQSMKSIRGKNNIYLEQIFKVSFGRMPEMENQLYQSEGSWKAWDLDIEQKTVEYLFYIREDERSFHALG